MLTQWLLPTPTLGMFFSTVVVWESNGAFGPKNKERRESIQSQCRDAFRREIIIERRIEHWFVQILLAQTTWFTWISRYSTRKHIAQVEIFEC